MTELAKRIFLSIHFPIILTTRLKIKVSAQLPIKKNILALTISLKL